MTNGRFLAAVLGDKVSPVVDKDINSPQLKGLAEGLKAYGDVSEALRQMQILGGAKTEKPSAMIEEGGKIVTAAQELSQKLSPSQSVPDQIKGIKETIQASKELTSEIEGKKKTEDGARFTVTEDGKIIPDEDDKLTFNQALLLSATQGKREGPLYYYQDPESGEYKEAKGPVVLRQESPPQIWQVDANSGEVTQLKPGQPVVVKPQPQQAKPYVVRIGADGQVTTEEVADPGKPIIIMPPQATAPSVFNLEGLDGKPLKLTKEAWEMQSSIWDAQLKAKHANERHGALMGMVSRVNDDLIPRASRAIDRMMAEEKKKPKTVETSTQQPQQFSRTYNCPKCKATIGITPETWAQIEEGFGLVCPNCQSQWTKADIEGEVK